MKFAWHEAEEIALVLIETYPDIDPLTLRFTELHKMVTELADFEDDPKGSNEGILEGIQMAWHEEIEDNK